MGKELTFKMSKKIVGMAEKPLRTREEAVLLLLYTIRMFDAERFFEDERSEEVKISINKMNRIFYLLEGKIFSIQFPFCIDRNSNREKTKIYYNITGTEINSIVLSFLIEVFEKMDQEDIDFETIFDLIMESEVNDNITMKERWLLILHLLKYDLGYIRYDNDPEHENGKMHPLNHLDVCLDTSASYKIGLDRKIDFDDLKNILDVTHECWFIR